MADQHAPGQEKITPNQNQITKDMKQVIFLGFYCQIYKKAPIARIYVGDTLIDEIEIPEFYDKGKIKNDNKSWFNFKKAGWGKLVTRLKFEGYDDDFTFFLEKQLTHTKHNHLLSPKWWYDELIIPAKNSYSKIFDMNDIWEECNKSAKYPKIFIYTIDDKILKENNGSLRIEIKNNDNNYNNGFMTKTTLIYFSHFYIIPEILFQNNIKIIQRFFDKFNRSAWAESVNNILKFYNFFHLPWPYNMQNDFKIISRSTNGLNHYITIGEDCVYEISFTNKHKIWWPKNKTPIGMFDLDWVLITNIIKNIFNKYKQDENQRSIN